MRRRHLLVLTALAALASCSKKQDDDGTMPVPMGSLKPLVLRDDTPDLMLTWIDEKGDAHVELKPADVPDQGRAMVRVVVADREDGTGDLFYVADLTHKQPDGSYEIHGMRRRRWENEIEKRREAALAKAAPTPKPVPSAPAATTGAAVTVIIYGASWCGPCHQAESYLKAKGVRYVMKDIESTPGAAAEMQEKLARAGQRGGTIPVIDVAGHILLGFSAGALDQALARARSATTL